MDSDKFLKEVVTRPGVYQFFDKDNNVLYVGKAANLKNRLRSYFRQTGLAPKTAKLMQNMHHIEVIVTQSETEALILEINLIKKYLPKYNILLRDDKSYPYLFVTQEAYPRLKFYRGNRNPKGQYFGPYPNVSVVKETIDLLQKTFLIRNCTNSFFKHRSRPCLQYQIGRCTAPCVDHVDQKDYQAQVEQALMFLEGKSQHLIETFNIAMQKASAEKRFEDAAKFRDNIKNLRKILEKQYISTDITTDADVIVCLKEAKLSVIQVFYYRGGQHSGTQAYYPKSRYDEEASLLLQTFLEQFYLHKAPPKEIITNIQPENTTLLNDFFKETHQRKVTFLQQPKTVKAKWLKVAIANTKMTLNNNVQTQARFSTQYAALEKTVGLAPIHKIACLDISHSMGEATYASFVVFDREGAKKSEYRKYQLQPKTKGDDYEAMALAIEKRLKGDLTNLPDIWFIDGGLGQARAAKKTLDHKLENPIVIGIAKGVSRKPGEEKLILMHQNERVLHLPGTSDALHLIQQIRDESHRFALLGHRNKRDKTRLTSKLEEIEGVGKTRKKALIKHFGGLKEVQAASIDELKKVPKISTQLAEKIYIFFHGSL